MSRRDFATILAVFRHTNNHHNHHDHHNHGASASLDFGPPPPQQQVSYVRFLSVVSRRYANAVVSGQVEPDGSMRLSGEAVKERIRRVRALLVAVGLLGWDY